jgi:hypothetical protein
VKDYLADVLLPSDKPESVAFRVGTISATSPVGVDIGGETGLNASYLNTYTPTNGHVVLVLATDIDLVILGRIISGG